MGGRGNTLLPWKLFILCPSQWHLLCTCIIPLLILIFLFILNLHISKKTFVIKANIPFFRTTLPICTSVVLAPTIIIQRKLSFEHVFNARPLYCHEIISVPQWDEEICLFVQFVCWYHFLSHPTRKLLSHLHLHSPLYCMACCKLMTVNIAYPNKKWSVLSPGVGIFTQR